MKKKLHDHFIDHLRSYRTFHFMFFTFILCITSCLITLFGNRIYAGDLLEEAFKPAVSHETIINLGGGKNPVGSEVFRESIVVQDMAGQGCFVNNKRIKTKDIEAQIEGWGYTGEVKNFCEEILGGDWDVSVLQTEAPLIVRIAKFILRITMVLAVTMVIFNGVMWIIESAKGAEVKDAKKNISLIIVGILIALMSLMIINIITSITKSSLGTSSSGNTAGCLINGEKLVDDNLKKYICENVTFGTTFTGTRFPNRPVNRCNRNGERKTITNTEMISKCIELGGEYIY